VVATITDEHQPDVAELSLVHVLDALSDPVRLEIVHALDRYDGNVACVDMRLSVSKSTASHHLKVLREAGVVTSRNEGTRRFYSLRRADLDARFPGLLTSVLRASA
jgi:DNA-binding transcriptional ArsR family regulator